MLRRSFIKMAVAALIGLWRECAVGSISERMKMKVMNHWWRLGLDWKIVVVGAVTILGSLASGQSLWDLVGHTFVLAIGFIGALWLLGGTVVFKERLDDSDHGAALEVVGGRRGDSPGVDRLDREVDEGSRRI